MKPSGMSRESSKSSFAPTISARSSGSQSQLQKVRAFFSSFSLSNSGKKQDNKIAVRRHDDVSAEENSYSTSSTKNASPSLASMVASTATSMDTIPLDDSKPIRSSHASNNSLKSRKSLQQNNPKEYSSRRSMISNTLLG